MNTSGLRIALDLAELGARLRAQRHRREHPEASEAEVNRVVADWYACRTIAPIGDSVGRPVPWPRQQ